jgi:hypothetical protein
LIDAGNEGKPLVDFVEIRESFSKIAATWPFDIKLSKFGLEADCKNWLQQALTQASGHIIFAHCLPSHNKRIGGFGGSANEIHSEGVVVVGIPKGYPVSDTTQVFTKTDADMNKDQGAIKKLVIDFLNTPKNNQKQIYRNCGKISRDPKAMLTSVSCRTIELK